MEARETSQLFPSIPGTICQPSEIFCKSIFPSPLLSDMSFPVFPRTSEEWILPTRIQNIPCLPHTPACAHTCVRVSMLTYWEHPPTQVFRGGLPQSYITQHPDSSALLWLPWVHSQQILHLQKERRKLNINGWVWHLGTIVSQEHLAKLQVWVEQCWFSRKL